MSTSGWEIKLEQLCNNKRLKRQRNYLQNVDKNKGCTSRILCKIGYVKKQYLWRKMRKKLKVRKCKIWSSFTVKDGDLGVICTVDS